PSLSCRSGGTAKFVAGGELPIPFTTGLGNASVMFKEYGIKFDVNPVVSETGVIAARIATEVSAINFDVRVKDVPGITKRRAETEVDLREHETLVIAGLLSEESSRGIDKLPALGDVPVLGHLFRSRAFRDQQTELVVFITPRFANAERFAPAAAPSSVAAPAPASTPTSASSVSTSPPPSPSPSDAPAPAPATSGDELAGAADREAVAPAGSASAPLERSPAVERLRPGSFQQRFDQTRERVRARMIE
ncbi:MAG TPA: type II and III secretion system protein, partial [Quisquiliibacterium sp.]|nr:type II and III secretion system protein [Quisquiliibacterium sp.]